MSLGEFRRGRFTVLVAALVAFGIGASYANSFGIGFFFDDSYGIAKNPIIRSLWNIPRFFVDPHASWMVATQVDVRPMVLISYALNYAISGLQPWSYHLVNLLLHGTAAMLVFVIVRDHVWWPRGTADTAGDGPVMAAAAALLFALAPLNSQPVDYVWARSALLCVTLYLGAFLAYLRARWVLGSVLFALALLTKAIAVTLPAVLLIHDLVYRDHREWKRLSQSAAAWGRLLRPVVLPAALAVAYVVYRHLVLPPWTGEARQVPGVTPAIWFMSQWSALLYYVRLFVWPDGLSVDHDYPYNMSLLQFRAWGALLVLLGWIGLAVRAAPRYPQVTFATAWFFVTLAPESSFAPLAEVINDHRPYIASSLGLSVLLVWLLAQAARLAGQRRRIVVVTATAVLCCAAVPMNRYRTWQWSDPVRLWDDALDKNPNNGRAWLNAGVELMARGELVKARRYFERARALIPTYSWLYMNFSVLDAAERHFDEALRDAQEAVRLGPDQERAHYFLGRALETLGRNDEAIAAYQRAVDLSPVDTELREALTSLRSRSAATAHRGSANGPPIEEIMRQGLDALYQRHDPAAAAVRFREVLSREPTHYGAYYQLATALDAAGKPAEARPLWEEMLVMAEASHDSDTVATVRTRLQKTP